MNKVEQEAIEYLEGMLNMYNNRPAPISQKALKILVNLIEKQQQDIEKLRKVLNVEKVMCEDMIGDVEIVCMYKRNFLREYGDDYISKDKIRTKIEELEHKDFIAMQVVMKHDKEALKIVDVLKDLLEEN